MLQPLIKTWRDDNLPELVERLIRTGIERMLPSSELKSSAPAKSGGLETWRISPPAVLTSRNAWRGEREGAVALQERRLG